MVFASVIGSIISETIVLIAHFSYLLVFLSFLLRNILYLRLMSVAASIATILFSAFSAPQPDWLPIIWNFLFVLVNFWQITVLLYQRREREWTEIEKFLFQSALKLFPKNEVKSFLAAGTLKEFSSGTEIIKMGTKLDSLYLLIEGDVQVFVQSKEVATLKAGNFLGEMSFLTKDLTRADVNAKSPVKVFFWKRDSLERWTDQDPIRQGYLQAALGSQLIGQLMAKSAV